MYPENLALKRGERMYCALPKIAEPVQLSMGGNPVEFKIKKEHTNGGIEADGFPVDWSKEVIRNKRLL